MPTKSLRRRLRAKLRVLAARGRKAGALPSPPPARLVAGSDAPRVRVTGANRGLGLAFVRAYAAGGWRVEACCRDPGSAEALRGVAGEFALHALDVTRGDQVAALAARLGELPLDLIINNAGVSPPKPPLGETDYERWLATLEINTLGPMRIAEHFAEPLAAGQGKLLVNISSRVGSIADNRGGGMYAYRTSKTALNMLVKGLSVDLRPRGIAVVALHPGWVRTDMGGPRASLSPEASVAGMTAVIEGLTMADSGRFYDYNGRELPW